MSEPVFVAFATQKGGVGKSTLTALVASYLHYNEGVNVLAMDCDDRQHSLKDYRDQDNLVTEENPILKKALYSFYKNFKKKAYEIVLTNPKEAIRLISEKLNAGANPDVVFFDITGTINDPDIVMLLSVMDYIFVPVTIDTADMKSSIRFASHVVNKMITTNKTKIKALRLVWNKIPTRTKPNLCEIVDKYMAELGLESLESVLTNSCKFYKDGAVSGKTALFRSTVLPPDKQLLKCSNLPELVAEIRETIKV